MKHHMLHDVFVPALKSLGVEETPFVVQHSFSVSDIEPLPTTLPVYSPEKTVFNFLPYPRSSDYERQFMSYLDRQEEVVAFTKVFRRFPVQMPARTRCGSRPSPISRLE